MRNCPHCGKPLDKHFRFHWGDGAIDEGDGMDAADALTRLGYGAGALPALDWHEEVLDGKEP